MTAFGDTWEILPVLRSKVAENDPLLAPDCEFFSLLAGKLEHVTTPDGFDAAYEESVRSLPEELRENMPAGFDRTLLTAVCSEPSFLSAWAHDHADFVLMGRLGPVSVMRFVFWPPHWWPINLLIYVPLALAFIGGALAQVYGPSVVQPVILFGLFLGYLSLCLIVVAAAVIFFSVLITPITLLFAGIVHGIDWLGDLGRLKTIERTKARRIKKETRRAQREAAHG